MPDFSIEQSFNQNVIGIDEVGRGPLAGPVISCAFIFFRTLIHPIDLSFIDNEPYFIEVNPFGSNYSAGSSLFHWILDEKLLYNTDNIIYFRYTS